MKRHSISIIFFLIVSTKCFSQLSFGSSSTIPLGRDHFKGVGFGATLDARLLIVSKFGLGINTSYSFHHPAESNIYNYESWIIGGELSGMLIRKPEIWFSMGLAQIQSSFETDKVDLGQGAFYKTPISIFAYKFFTLGAGIKINPHILGGIEFYFVKLDNLELRGYESNLFQLKISYIFWKLKPLFGDYKDADEPIID